MERAPRRTEDDVTAGVHAEAATDVARWPSLTLSERQLADTELLLSGAFAPLTGFMGEADVASVAEHAALADGTPWPFPVTLEVAMARSGGCSAARPRSGPNSAASPCSPSPPAVR